MEVLEVLKQCRISDNVVTLPDTQLDRKTYQDVAKKIELIGGKWNRKFKGFLFEQNPTELFSDICNGDKRNLKKEFQFFATPESLVGELCSFIPKNVEDILEPSAGRGAIVQGINKACPDIPVYYCELMDLNRKQFKGEANYLDDDFLSLDEENIRKFGCIVANPPFSKNQDIEHFYKMYKMCKNGGRIISVMSKHWQLSSNKKETEFREFLYSRNAKIIDIEAGKFKESGTMTATCYVVLDKNEPEIGCVDNKMEVKKTMGRKKKSSYEEYEKAEKAFEEQNATTTTEEEVIAESDPQTEIEPEEAENHLTDGETEGKDNEPAYEQVKCPNTFCNFHLEFKEGAKCVNCGFVFTKKNMAEFTEKDLHEEANKDFIEGISEIPKKLTIKQRDAKIVSLKEDIEKATIKMNELESTAELATHPGIRALVERRKKLINDKVAKEEITEINKGSKTLDAVTTTERLIKLDSAAYNDAKSSIKKWEREIEELKAGQLSLLDGGKADEEEVTEANTEASASTVDELAAVG